MSHNERLFLYAFTLLAETLNSLLVLLDFAYRFAVIVPSSYTFTMNESWRTLSFIAFPSSSCFVFSWPSLNKNKTFYKAHPHFSHAKCQIQANLGPTALNTKETPITSTST